MMARWARLGRLALAITLTAGTAVLSVATSTAASAGTVRARAGSSAYDWPELHQNAALTGYAANSSISASNAGTLGIRWGADLYSAILDSPVIAYDASLGRTLVYVGTDSGIFYAIDKATGDIVWADQLSGPVRSSPLVSDGAVWVGTALNATVYKLNASTGAIECTQGVPVWVDSSPVAATPPGGKASVYFAAFHDVLSLSAASCAVQWTFSGQADTAAVWDPLSYVVDGAGEPLLLFGDADPDNSAYALNAVTGKEVWRYQTTTVGDSDIGSGETISPPGVNGFTDGVAYVPAKDGYVYALDLKTGVKLWQTSLGSYAGAPNESLATAALVGTNLVVGTAVGAVDLNAVTGATVWSYQTPVNSQLTPPVPSEVVSSPAVSGPAGQQAITFGDLGGAVRTLSLATGALLYSHQTGSWITAGPAVSAGDMVIGSADGFLYDFSAGGGNDTPQATITSPVRGAVVANPRGKINVTGAATAQAGVAAVVVAVRQGGVGGMWWDAATARWSASPVTAAANLSAPKATTTGWSLQVPVPPSGGAYRIDAYAVSVSGSSQVPAADDEFFVSPTQGGPALTVLGGAYAGPGARLQVSGTGFGPDEPVTITMLGSKLASVKSLANGSFPATSMTVPATAGFGPTALVATGTTNKRAAAASLYVTNNWDQQGRGPGRSGAEPNDPVIDNTVDPGDNILLNPAWHDSFGHPLTSPAVVNQVVYTADGSGNLYAVRARTGDTVWTWQTPTGAAITGSPSVDVASGLAYVGAADGKLYAVHTVGSSAGKLAWSASVGTGDVESPVFSGTSLYAAATGGQVAELSAATGTATWTAKTPSAVTAAPALGPAALVLPTSSGLVALKPASGARMWTFAATDPAPPVMSASTVYAGSSDGHVYAVSESTGKQVWSAATGGAVTDAGAFTYTPGGLVKWVWIGSNDGNLYAFGGGTGVREAVYPIGSAVTGVSIAVNTALITTSSGLVVGARLWNRGTVVWTEASGDGAMSQPAVVDGAMYATGENGALWAFTPYGEPPA
jgi:outer membrane protein assembly factor BamB